MPLLKALTELKETTLKPSCLEKNCIDLMSVLIDIYNGGDNRRPGRHVTAGVYLFVWEQNKPQHYEQVQGMFQDLLLMGQGRDDYSCHSGSQRDLMRDLIYDRCKSGHVGG